MRRTLVGLFALCSSALYLSGGPAAVSAQAQGNIIAIQGGTLIDGNGGAPVPNSVVVIQGNRITAVGRAGQVQVPGGAQVINANGKYVLPGLMDAKGNWNWQYGEGYINYGVTSNFVTGPRNDQGLADRDAIYHGIFAGPRLFQGIIGLQGPGPKGDKKDQFKFGDFNRIARTAEGNSNFARTYLQNGADLIVWVDGDGPPEIFAPAVKATLAANKAVVFRSMGPQTRAKEVCAMGNGVVYIHTGNIGAQIAKDESKWATYIGLPPDAYADMDDAKADAAIKTLVACNAYLEPDFMAADRGFHKSWARVQQESREFYGNPAMAYYPAHAAQGVIENQKSPETYMQPAALQARAAGFKNHAIFLKRYVDAGGKIVAASDTPQSAPGLGLHQEMTAFVEDIGLTPMQAILSATKWVAEGFKQPDLGVIAPGKLADVIVVDADPLADIKNLRKVSTVIFDGKPVQLGYHAWYGGGMFARPGTDLDEVVSRPDWVAALKEATWRPNNVNGGFGGPGGIDSATSPTPAIETVSVHTIIRRSPATPVTLTGFNYVRGSQAYFDGSPIPTQVVSRTEIRATIPENLLGRAGNFPLTVKNPAPISTAVTDWGDTSNEAFILVPFEFTTKWSQNKY
jgi:hypothetical protein